MWATDTRPITGTTHFRVRGTIALGGGNTELAELALRVIALSPVGETLGSGTLDARGNFDIALALTTATDIRVLVGPGADAVTLSEAHAFATTFVAARWTAEPGGFVICACLSIPKPVWWPWHPRRLRISGCLRSSPSWAGAANFRALPDCNVELFDVDREAYWLALIGEGSDAGSGGAVIRIPDLIHTGQPLGGRMPATGGRRPQCLADSASVGGERVTLTSRLAPWLLLPQCFYSRHLLGETRTDSAGHFSCECAWWPVHVRKGRLRYAVRPDILVRATWLDEGRRTVTYLDACVSTCWQADDAFLDLHLAGADEHSRLTGGMASAPPTPGGNGMNSAYERCGAGFE